MPLFRPESLRSQDRLHGDVNLAPPTSWQTMTLVLAGIFGSAIAFLFLAPYARTAQAEGVVESDRGTLDIVTPVGGSVSRLLVAQGSRVRAGQPIAVIVRSTPSGGGDLERRRIDALALQDRSLAEKSPALREAARARIAEFQADADRAAADEAEISTQIAGQRDLITAAASDLAKAREVAERGFISQRDMRLREESLASRQQGMSRLMQGLAAARSERRVAERRMDQEKAALDMQIAQNGGDRAAIALRTADMDNISSVTVKAPVDGVVSDMAQTVSGRAVTSGQTVATVIPAGGRLRLRLNLPATAVPQIAPGQEARVAVDAFPYQTYGTVPARIERITEAATGDGAFTAFASLGTTRVRAYGVESPLRPGMKVTARIRTARRTLAQWLLDPLYAVARR